MNLNINDPNFLIQNASYDVLNDGTILVTVVGSTTYFVQYYPFNFDEDYVHFYHEDVGHHCNCSVQLIGEHYNTLDFVRFDRYNGDNKYQFLYIPVKNLK